MKDRKYYLDRVNEIMERGFLTKLSLCNEIGISYITFQKFMKDEKNVGFFSMRKIKEFVDTCDNDFGDYDAGEK